MTPDTATDAEQTSRIAAAWKKQGLSIALVPTMGYLHEGHISLIRRARRENDRLIASIFVNPRQFSPSEDLAAYPRNLERDLEICRNEGVDLVFTPGPEQMYPQGFQTNVSVENLSGGLCGASRPGHFTGVCTVVCKLFNITGADRAYFGQKDAQQLAVIKRMVRDLNMGVEIIGCPIVREADGLAKSSRNSYLNTQEREAALCLSRALAKAGDEIAAGVTEAAAVSAAMRAVLDAQILARTDYIAVVDPDSLEPVPVIGAKALIALAVFIGSTRLIDNMLIER